MKNNTFTFTLCLVVLSTLIFQTGCEEQTKRRERLDPEWFNQPVWQELRASGGRTAPAYESNPAVNNVRNNRAPKVEFAKMSHDFGRIGPDSTNNICEFVFTNTGNANLVISSLKTSCSCTPAILEGKKMEYAPGESGKIFVAYTDNELGQTIKHIYLNSNDPATPKAELAITAEVVAPIDYEPKKITLSIKENNGNCPAITVRSLDNQPFSITGFESDYNFIKVDYNPNEKATRFVLKPQVDMMQLNGAPEGRFQIKLSHPNCKAVSGSFYTPPRFSISPQRLVVNQADPSKTVVKTINITSNYNEDFDVETAISRKGIVNIIDTLRTRNGYKVTVEIRPPNNTNNASTFSDNINISLPGIESFNIKCDGYYPGAVIPEGDGKCKTCGPVRVDNPGMSMYPR